MKSLHGVLDQVRRVAAVQTSRGLADGELLERFVGAKDEAAFTVLVQRHGPLVLGVCRRALGNAHDAEDACQATFLLLARKAASIRKAASLSSWLHRVASSVAANMKREQARRCRRERQVQPVMAQDPAADVSWREVQTALDEDLQRLPERYRAPLILCYLDRQTRDEAAEQLRLTPAALHGRLERGRKLLCERLTRRGMALSGTLLAAAVGEGVSQAALSPSVILSLTKAATLVASGKPSAVTTVPAHVLSLTREALRTLLLAKLNMGAATVLCAGLSLAAVGAMLMPTGSRQDADPGSKAMVADARGAPRVDETATEDAKNLEGEWQVVETEANGKKSPSYEVRSHRIIFAFKGDEITANFDGRTKFKLNADTVPKAMDITWIDGKWQGLTAASIYSLEEGRLRLCMPAWKGKRPTEFKTRDGDGLHLYVLERITPKEAGKESAPQQRPGDKAAEQFGAILRAWRQADQEFWKAHRKAKTADERRKVVAEKSPNPEPLAERCLKLAETYPDTPAGLAALCWAISKAPKTEAGKKALTTLQGGLIARADLEDLMSAFDSAQSMHGEVAQQLAPLVFQRVKQQLDHPKTARLLTWVCTCFWGDESAEAPALFTEAADLIVRRFVDRPDINHLCECLGGTGGHVPPWAGKCKEHLRAILKTNRHLAVRSTAHLALASILQEGGEEEQAKQLYEQFVKEYEAGAPNDPWEGILKQQVIRIKVTE